MDPAFDLAVFRGLKKPVHRLHRPRSFAEIHDELIEAFEKQVGYAPVPGSVFDELTLAAALLTQETEQQIATLDSISSLHEQTVEELDRLASR